jgi:hypothetical protein
MRVYKDLCPGMHEVVGSRFHAYDTTAMVLVDRRGHTCVFVDGPAGGNPLGSETCRYLKRAVYNLAVESQKVVPTSLFGSLRKSYHVS